MRLAGLQDACRPGFCLVEAAGSRFKPVLIPLPAVSGRPHGVLKRMGCVGMDLDVAEPFVVAIESLHVQYIST